MASQTPQNKPSKVRHRIKEITLHPTTSKYPIELEISVDNKFVRKHSTIKPNHSLSWDLQTYPCDVYIGAKIGLRFVEKHTASDREVVMEYTVSGDMDQPPITQDVGAFPSSRISISRVFKKNNTPGGERPLNITVVFLNASEIAKNYSNAFERAAKMVEDERGPLDKIGNARGVLKTILGLGEVVAELHPTAKLVVGLCTKAWEHLEQMQGQYDNLKQLVDGLEEMVPFIESVKRHAKEAVLKDTIIALLFLIEDTSNLVINDMSHTSATRRIRGYLEGQTSDRISELLQKFGSLKGSFDRGVGVQVMKQGLSAAQCTLIDRLKAPTTSPDTMPSPCQEGTRTQVLEHIRAWHHDTESPQKLLWIYGQAGMGKSSIASSTCQMLSDERALGAYFFFKRDDPYLRSPEHMLNTIVHRLAHQYEPYGRAVAKAIEEDSSLPGMPLGQRYVRLVESPLDALGRSKESPSRALVIVVDALDECEHTNSRGLLLTYMWTMSRLVPWLKFVVTSRPDPDIKKAFGGTEDNSVMLCNIIDYDASGDIAEFTDKRMAAIAANHEQLKWPEGSIQLLTTRADGLFIWAETACKFIEKGTDPIRCLEKILEGTQKTRASTSLDKLYTTAIRQRSSEKDENGEEDEEDLQNIRECLGAIIVTASRTPLSVAGLESLLSTRVRPGVFRVVVSRLGSVLYEDHSRGGVVRVYHPSFADFVLDQARAKDFYTDLKQQEVVLADCCLKTMMKELAFNICGLETSHLPNVKVPNLSTRVRTAISRQLEYSCMHWSSHLTGTSTGDLKEQLGGFLYERQLLYWIEAMSLLGQLSVALSSLLGAVEWTSDTMVDYSSYANDAYRFILTFYDAISESTPHLYISALAFAPARSKVAQRMRPLFPNTFTVNTGANESWSAWLQSMPHNDWIVSIACLTDGGRIVCGSSDGTVRIWDSETGAAVSEPLASPDLSCVAISPNGRRVASGSSLYKSPEGTLQVWDVETGATVLELSGRRFGSCISIAFSPDNQRIFYGRRDGVVCISDAESGAEISELHLVHSDDILSTALSPDGRCIASCSKDRTVRVWSAETGAPVTEPLAGHSDWVRCIAFSPDGCLLASGSNDDTVRLWEISTGTQLHQLTGRSGWVFSVAFSPSGRYLVSGSWDCTVRVWDVKPGMPACEPLVGHANLVNSVAFCSNGRRVVSASHDKTIRIWDVEAGSAVSQAPVGHSSVVNSVAFSADGRYLASGSKDGTVRIWDVNTGAEAFEPFTGSSGSVRFVFFTPDSRRIVSLVGDKAIQVWDVNTSDLSGEFSFSHMEDALSIALSPDGFRIASGSEDHTVGLWDLDTGAAVFPPLAGHSDAVLSVVFSPDGRFIASGSVDRAVRIWEVKNGDAVGEPLTGHSDSVQSVCFSPNSPRIASGSADTTVRVWDIETGAALLDPLRGHSSSVLSVVFSPDGRFIISGSWDVNVRIWDADTGAAVAEPLVGHSGWVMSVAVSPDSRHIATGSTDSTVRIWDMKTATTDPDELIHALLSAPSTLSLSTGFLACYANESGWVTSSDGTLLLWLPKDRRYKDDSIIQISADPFEPRPLFLDFSKFVCGDVWATVASN